VGWDALGFVFFAAAFPHVFTHTYGPFAMLRVTASCLLIQTDCERGKERQRLREPQSAEEGSESATTAVFAVLLKELACVRGIFCVLPGKKWLFFSPVT